MGKTSPKLHSSNLPNTPQFPGIIAKDGVISKEIILVLVENERFLLENVQAEEFSWKGASEWNSVGKLNENGCPRRILLKEKIQGKMCGN